MYINEEKCPKIVQNEEKMHFIPHMLAYVGIFLYLCALNCELQFFGAHIRERKG